MARTVLASVQAPDSEYHDRLHAWLAAEAGVFEVRRVVRRSKGRTVISKVPDGFLDGLDRAIDGAPGLFDTVLHRRLTRTVMGTGLSRAEAWRRGVESALRECESQGLLDAKQRAEILAGVDSVAAILASVSWTSPAGPGTWRPSPEEQRAFAETLAALRPGAPIFTRDYGVFEGTRVVNYCPGARYALRLLECGWAAMTDEDAARPPGQDPGDA